MDVTITAPGGTSATSAADRFTYIAAPIVTSISPSSGPAGGGTSVTITGANFTGASSVKFGLVEASFTVNTATSITATSSAGAGTVDVTVTTAGGTSATSAADKFTYIAAPAVTSISPLSGSAAGGTSVTIFGTNFTGATAVKFGTTAAASFTIDTPTQITATSPAGSGTVDVTVTSPGGTSATSIFDRFTYVPPPAVTSISPASGPAAGGTSVTITGTSFFGVTAVKFGSTPAASFTANTPTSITATSPPGTGTVDVTVTATLGTSAIVAADQFTYLPGPTITSISPSNGPSTGGTSVTITGTNFTGATAVKFGSTPATSFTVNTATSITATSPAGAGTVDITVTAPGGTSPTNPSDQFSYTGAPTVTSVSPSSGRLAGGTSVTITGTNFTAATAVKFGSAAATSFTVNTATSITATSPAGTGTVDVTVTTPGGTSPVTASDKFTYLASDATLVNLTVSQGTLSPSFAPALTSYTDSVGNGITAMTVTPTVNDSSAKVTVNGQAVSSGSASQSISLNVGSSNTISVLVTAADGTTTKTYTVTVTRAASSNANLSNLILSTGTLSPAFATPTLSYTAFVPIAVPSITVTPTLTDVAATEKVNGTTVASGSPSTPINLNVGTNTITIVVTAQDGVTTQTYTIVVTRDVPPDSQRLRAIQNAVTPLVAQTSGMAMSSAIDGAIGTAFGGGGQFFSVGPTGMTFNFAADPATLNTPLREEANANQRGTVRTDDAFAKALGYDRMPGKAAAAAPAPPKDWSLWLDIRGTGWKVTDPANTPTPGVVADVTGSQLNVTAGFGRKLTPDLLVGIIAGGEFFKYDVTSLSGTLKGDGASVGAYVARLFGNLRADAAFVYSAMHYDVTSGTASGSIKASRWMGSGGLTGNYKWGDYLLEPSAKIYILTEHEKDWTDTLGTPQPARDFTTGRASAGGKVGRLFDVNGLRLLPYVGLYADYVLMSDNAVLIGPPVATLHAGWAARATTGLGLSTPSGGRFSVGGELGGLGAQYKVWTGNVRVNLPF